MIIVSQDRRSIVNFDRVKTIELDRETNFTNIFAYIGEGNSTAFKHLGGYETQERAREVLQGIVKAFQVTKALKICENRLSAEDILEAIKGNFVYEMPLE